MSTSSKVHSFLSENDGEEFNIKTLAKELRLSYNAIKKACQRLHRSSQIHRTEMGFYTIKRPESRAVGRELQNRLNDSELLIHGLHIKAAGSLAKATPPPGSLAMSPFGDSSAQRIVAHNVAKAKMWNTCKPLQQLQTSITDAWQWKGNKGSSEHIWQGRKILVEWSSKSVEIRVSCSEVPMDAMDFNGFLAWCEAMFDPGFWQLDWQVVHIGVNKDSKDLWLEGVSCISLRDVKGEIRRWYNKRKLGVCRRENHEPAKVPLVEAVRHLMGKDFPGYSDLKGDINELTKAIKELAKEHRRVQKTGDKMLEAVCELKPGTVIHYGDPKP